MKAHRITAALIWLGAGLLEIGLNYYIDSHRLKLMSGVKYSHLNGGPDGGDFNGWTWLAGVRMAF